MKKTPTIFKRNPENMKQILNEANPECGWVFAGEGIATRKYDGTCCLVRDGILYKRRELRQGDKEPSGFELADFDDKTGKTVGWVPVSKDDPTDKYHNLAFDSKFHLKDGTYELLGDKIQANPENVNGYILLKHSDAEEMYPPRDFEGLREWLKDKDIEGIVFHHEDGRMAKIKKRDFSIAR